MKSHIGANFMGDRVATLLGHLLASLMRNLLALRVSHLDEIFKPIEIREKPTVVQTS